MARRTQKEEATLGSQMWKHEDLADYVEEEEGVKLSSKTPAEVIALGFKYKNQWRKTSRYEDLVEGHREEAAEVRKERQKAARASKKKAPAKKKAGARKRTAKKKSPAKRASRRKK